jgi:hypothetical protein
MGNQGSALGDEPSTPGVAQRNLQHFDHSFKGELHTTHGMKFVDVFGECKFAKRPVSVICKASGIEILEEVGITSKKQCPVDYFLISGLSWGNVIPLRFPVFLLSFI